MLPHPYCRTCGSTITRKDVCQNCGCDPMKGGNYCCDCGTSTMPQAIMCIHCGASFQSKFPATLAILISGALLVTIIFTGYFLTHSSGQTAETLTDSATATSSNDSLGAKKFIPVNGNESLSTITNNIILKPRKNVDAIKRLTKNLMPEKFAEAKPKKQVTETPAKKINREENVNNLPERNAPVPSRVSPNIFSAGELSKYSVGCTYYEGKHKGNIIFFTTNVYGYIKINGKIYPMQGYQKTNDIARFAGTFYDVSIEIEGLAGNENDWVATGTLTVKNKEQRTLAVHKIYSSCTEF